MTAFVLAHLSDPHLAPFPRPRLAELAGKRGLGFANWWRKRRRIHRADVLEKIVEHLKASAPDHIALTGDLVNISLPGEFAPARRWLEALGPAKEVTLVPGNHDAYVRSADGQSEVHWGDYMRGDGGEQGFPFVRRRGPLALIGLSSALPTGPLMATGCLGSEQLRQLAPLLDQLGRSEVFRVVLVHHPPRSKRYLKRLVDGEALGEILCRHGAELVLHGHDHVHSLVHLDGPRGPIPAIGVPSASQIPIGKQDPAGYNLYRIDRPAGVWQCEVTSRWLSGDGQRMAESRRAIL
jgi:3',5'-cyclic AMP phosphodiesterase CpdA